MAKSSGVSKKLLAKKDMNFFAEFTANAAKAARMLGYGVAAGVLVVFVVLAFIVAFFIRNTIIKGQIRDMENLLASEAYASLEAEYERLKEQLNEMSNYNYALTQMRKTVDEIDAAPTDLPDVIAKCIPSDSYITHYLITSSQLDLEGYTFVYFSPAEMIYLLNQKNVFTARPSIQIERAEAESSGEEYDAKTKTTTVDVINTYYKFTISGMLVSNAHINIIRYEDIADSTKVLGMVESRSVKAGDSYEIDIANFTYAGIEYKLTKIYVDDVIVDEASFAEIVANGKFTDVARKNAEVKLYYAPVTAQAAPAAQG
ncbi:MAG: hypothetical protein SPL61_02990 [Saccharofermentans sp.]|jgi:hypothetical protein|nr:hypothetical protein [Saccharofermentans sp.]